jgi:hypothetical protein
MAALAATLFFTASVTAQDCCSHLGKEVQCPPGLAPGSASVEFVPGGTQWQTPTGASVFVPQTSFPACTSTPQQPTLPKAQPTPPTTTPPIPTKPQPPAPTTTPPTVTKPQLTQPTPAPPTAPKPPSGQTLERFPVLPPPAIAPPEFGGGDGTRGPLLNQPPEQPMVPAPPSPDAGKTTHEQIQRLGREFRGQQVASQEVKLKEDPAMACYRRTQATVLDGHAVGHTTDLQTQLGSALGIERAEIGCAAGVLCQSPAYDCAGDFYDASGKLTRVPAFPATAGTDADVASWLATVNAFYEGSYTDAKKAHKLSPGKVQLCVAWARVHFQANPDPSVLQAMTALQEIGGESMVGIDSVWLTNIVRAAEGRGCSTPAPLARNEISGWWVPTADAAAFYAQFRDCARPDVNKLGGCPHPFDAFPGNHVNDDYLFDAESLGARPNAAAAMIGD